jgi:hypothetical protein
MANVVRSDWHRSEHTRGSISVLQGDQEMNKLSALSKLANAYHHFVTGETQEIGSGDIQAATILAEKFGYVRRSLTIEDLKPQPKCIEGFNGKMPTHF